jgi:5-methyltetrahydrofolate--homocysteine methyltransferase
MPSQDLTRAILSGRKDAVALARERLSAGETPTTILREGVAPAVAALADDFHAGRRLLPDVRRVAELARAVVAEISPPSGSPDVVIGTVAGGVHDLGKNLVALLLEADGYEVLDLGVDVPVGRFLAAVERHRPRVLAMSALIPATTAVMRDTVRALAAAGLREAVRVVVGGAAVSEALAQEIGADGYAPDAFGALALVRNLIGLAERRLA